MFFKPNPRAVEFVFSFSCSWVGKVGYLSLWNWRDLLIKNLFEIRLSLFSAFVHSVQNPVQAAPENSAAIFSPISLFLCLVCVWSLHCIKCHHNLRCTSSFLDLEPFFTFVFEELHALETLRICACTMTDEQQCLIPLANTNKINFTANAVKDYFQISIIKKYWLPSKRTKYFYTYHARNGISSDKYSTMLWKYELCIVLIFPRCFIWSCTRRSVASW